MVGKKLYFILLRALIIAQSASKFNILYVNQIFFN